MNPSPQVQTHPSSPASWIEPASHAPPDAHSPTCGVFAQILEDQHPATPRATRAESRLLGSAKDLQPNIAALATQKKNEPRGESGYTSLRPDGRATDGPRPSASATLTPPPVISKTPRRAAAEAASTRRRSLKNEPPPASAHPNDSNPAYLGLSATDPSPETPPVGAFPGGFPPGDNAENPETIQRLEEGLPLGSDARLRGGNFANAQEDGQVIPGRSMPVKAGNTAASTLSPTEGADLPAGVAAGKAEIPAAVSPGDHHEPPAASALPAKPVAISSANPNEPPRDPSAPADLPKESTTHSAAAFAEPTDSHSARNDSHPNSRFQGGPPDSSPDGMPDAPSDMPMKMADKMNQFASFKEQYLPQPPTGPTVAPAPAVILEQHWADQAPVNPLATGSPIDGLSPTPEPPSSASIQTEAAPAVDHASRVEKLTELFAGKILELKQSSAVQMTAVLRPDPQTELHVHLRLDASGIQMYARCDQGDSQALSAQWHRIQQALAPQGIHLANLNEPPPASAASGPFAGPSGQSHQQPSERQGTPPDQTPLEFEEELASPAAATAGSVRRHSRSPQLAGRRWESWA